MDTLDTRVCPDCGAPAGAQPFCGHCGVNLTGRDRLPTRREWESTSERERSPEADVAPAAQRSERPEAPSGSAADPSTWQLTSPAGPQPVFTTRVDPTYEGRPLANWGYRVGGWIVDVLGTAAVALGLGALLYAAGVDDDTASTVAGTSLLVLWLVNTTVLVGITGGRSVGKLVGGMRIVRDRGGRTGFGTGFLRDTVCRLIYFIPLGFLADSLWPLGDERQTLRDKMVATHVVQEPSYPRRAWILTLSALAAMGATYALASFSPDNWPASDYTASDRETFVSDCSEGGEVSEARCGCMYDYVSSEVPYDDYAEADSTDDESDWPANVRTALDDAAATC